MGAVQPFALLTFREAWQSYLLGWSVEHVQSDDLTINHRIMTTVHSGNITRWFEKLCRIEVPKLSLIAHEARNGLIAGKLPQKGGVYCFWWTGNVELLLDAECRRELTLSGPGGRLVPVRFDEDWLGASAGCPIPLYVGKTADSIAKRTHAHLLLRMERAIPTFEGNQKQKRPTTSCQLRAGVDQLFATRTDTRRLVLDNIGLSHVELHGDEHAVNRFYLETMAIGTMRPPLNIDVER